MRISDWSSDVCSSDLQGPYLAYAFIAEPADPDVEAARILCRRDFGDVFKRLLRKGIASGEFPKQSVDVSAACIVGAFTEALVRPVEHATKPKSGRQEERRGGKGGVSAWRSRWWRYQ